MHIQVTFSNFCDAFRDHGRDDQFTYAGKRVLFDYLEAYEDEIGESQEIDVIGLCCSFMEASYEEIAAMYSIEADDEDDIADSVRAHLEDHAVMVGEVTGGFVFANF